MNGNVSLNSTETKLFRTRHGLSLINNLIHEATDDVNSVWYSCTAHEIEIYDEIIEDYIFNKCHESCMCPGDTDDALVDTRFTVKLSVLSSSINCTEPQPATSDCQPDDFSPTNRKDELEFICDKEEENKDDKFNILNQNHKLFEPSIDDDQTSKASNHLENNFICDKSVQIHEDALLFGSPRLNSDYESLELDEHIDLNQCSQCTNALKALVLSKSPNEKVRDLITFVKGAFHAKSGGIDADHLLTTVISLIVLAKPDGLISNIRYIERFSNRHRISRGEPAFCLTTVVAAITAIDEMYAARFEVDAEVAYSIAPNFDQAHSKLPNIQSSTVLKTQKMDFFSEKIKADYRGGKSPKVDAGVGDHNLTNQALISKSSCETHTISEKSSKVTSSFMKTINSMPKAISNAVADTLSRSGWSGSSDPLPPANSKGVESGSASIKSIEDIKKRIIKGVSIEELTMSEVALALQDYSQIIRDQKTDGTR